MTLDPTYVTITPGRPNNDEMRKWIGDNIPNTDYAVMMSHMLYQFKYEHDAIAFKLRFGI